MTHRVVYIFLALVSATLLKAQLSGNGQQSFILGCVVTTGMICAPGSTVTPTSALVNQTLGACPRNAFRGCML